MFRPCPFCQQQNPVYANFCASCGRTVARTEGRSCCSGSKSGVAILALVIAGGMLFLGPRVWSWQSKLIPSFRPAPPRVTMGGKLNLPQDKAALVFDLLAPSDVKIRVGRRIDGVSVVGTANELLALRRLAALVTRFEGLSEDQVAARMQRARGRWTTTAVYKLPCAKGNVLFDLLAYDDVPLLVSGSCKRITVAATKEDQRTVSQLVRVMLGQRL